MPKLTSDPNQQIKMSHESIKPDNSDKKVNIWVGKLEPDVTEKQLDEYFSQFGKI